jgi:tetratricopeptide (TPR) repeat protein
MVEQQNATSNPDSNLRKLGIISAILFFATLALYFPVTGFGFVNFDDASYVYENQIVTQGLTKHGIVWAFNGQHEANWHPLTWISHMLDCQLFGLEPGAHHLHNVFLHAAAGTLLFLLLNRMTRAVWRSAFVAALFLWHPMHVESVAWIAERKDVLSAFYFMATLFAYTVYVERKSHSPTHRLTDSRLFYVTSLILYILGLLSKSMLVTLPFILLLLDAWPLGRLNKGTVATLIKEKIPFFLLSIVASVITFLSQRAGGAVVKLEHISIPDRIGNALISYVRYIQKLIWPSDLSFFYIMPPQVDWTFVIPAIALLLILTGVALAARRKMPWTTVGWLWFVGMLVPVIGLVQVGRMAMADRYSYLPSIGLFVAITWTIYEFTKSWAEKKLVPTFAIGALIALVAIAETQISFWQNSGTLTQHAIDVDPNNYVAHQNLGMFLFRQHRPDLAFEELSRANELHPQDPGILNSLAFVLMDLHEPQKAEAALKETLQINPNDAQALCTLGTIAIAKGKTAEGIAQIQKSVGIKPDRPEYRYELARALLAAHRLADALKEYRNTLQVDPNYKPALKELAWLLATAPQPEFRNGNEALKIVQHLTETVGKNDPSILSLADVAQAETGHFTDAISTAEFERLLYLRMGDTNSAALADKRIELYRQNKPFHTTAK